MAKFIITALSARGFAEAAVACGHDVIVLDAFADEDTQRVSTKTHKLNMHINNQGLSLDENDFKSVFSGINLADIDGFLYGSLFDNCPRLLEWVAEYESIVGNQPEMLKQAKDFSFFALLDDLGIQHPEVCLQMPDNPAQWLAKQLGGSGGTHIKPASQAKYFQKAYFQKKQAGTPISILFVADGKTAKTIGFNQQLIAPTDEMPYRFAGAVNNIALQPNICGAFEHASQQLTSALSLRGINSLDAILEGETLWILELNPRLSATFDLYENLFSLHLQGCAGNLMDSLPIIKTSKAQLILYADEVLEIPKDFAWPNWVADITALEVGESNVRIAQNMPICSVFAHADSAEVAHAQVRQRSDKLREMLYQ
ncbi:MAG: ATP-grasp domain-containing protein [Methylotenera sp.]